MTGRELHLSDGRTLRTYDSAAEATPDALTIVWHHGSPQTGTPLPPLLSAAAARGIRLVSYGRPSYGGSSPLPGRDVASAASDVAQMMDALGIARFATMGASGGGPHALACAALLPDRVTGVVCLAGIAPFTTGFDWFAGMASALNAPGTGVRATLVSVDTAGTKRLMVSSIASGQASQFTLTAADGSDLLGGATVASTGRDASITIGPDTITSATNTFADVVPGLSLTVSQAAVGAGW